MRRVHPYLPVSWRGTLPLDDDGRAAIFFSAPSGTLRYALDACSALNLAESLLGYLTKRCSRGERTSRHPRTRGTEMLKLGSKARDRVTGSVGILYARAEYLYGDTSWCLQGPVREDGKVPSAQWLVEQRLELVEE